MARMIPERPRSFMPASLEDVMFSALERLPEEYYVIHSFRAVTVQNGVLVESETDFVIFHRRKGILCIEAKAGHVKYIDGEWFYGGGKKMTHDGPYNQASQNKWRIKDLLEHSRYKDLIGKCKILHAVWFPSVNRTELNTVVIPPEADRNITLLKEDLPNPTSSIERIFGIELPNRVQTNLSEKDAENIVRKILCPSFDLIPSATIEHDLKKQVFHKLLSEQKCVLDFLVEQRSAVIQGAAGTGKTLIAIEKAQRHAEKGEKVLFLCYNRFLRDFIAEHNANEFIDCYTIDGFACKMCNTRTPDYLSLKTKLEEYYGNPDFPYKHVVIDEGQDFGQVNIEENDIIRLLEMIIMDRDDDTGSFYVFYDEMQLVQGEGIPDYISNADCKLTLYKNCRNTRKIATTSVKPLGKKRPKLIDSCVEGVTPQMFFCDGFTAQQQVLRVISDYEEQGLEDIVVLTCKTETTSCISPLAQNGKVNRKYQFTTCRKFKGLEADAIIIVDVDYSVLTTNATKIFYVGASRAKLYLSLFADMTDEECLRILEIMQVVPARRNPKKQLATALGAILVKENR